jgi:hypothetical protein
MRMVILYENGKNKFQPLDLNRWMRLKVLLNVSPYSISSHKPMLLGLLIFSNPLPSPSTIPATITLYVCADLVTFVSKKTIAS